MSWVDMVLQFGAKLGLAMKAHGDRLVNATAKLGGPGYTAADFEADLKECISDSLGVWATLTPAEGKAATQLPMAIFPTAASAIVGITPGREVDLAQALPTGSVLALSPVPNALVLRGDPSKTIPADVTSLTPVRLRVTLKANSTPDVGTYQALVFADDIAVASVLAILT